MSLINNYGQSKLQIKKILYDLVVSDPECKIIGQRYFNQVGPHEAELFVENPNNIQNNLTPCLIEAVTGGLTF